MTILLVLLISFVLGNCQNCYNCLNDAEKRFCLDNNTCLPLSTRCNKPVELKLNCPSALKTAYNETFFHDQVLVYMMSVTNKNPQGCIDNNIPSMNIHKIRVTNCSRYHNPLIDCTAFTAVDLRQNALLLVFRGAMKTEQQEEQVKLLEEFGTTPFFEKGRVLISFYDYFISLWNGGIGQDVRELKNRHPTFKLWIIGHSMGGGLALLASAYVVVRAEFEAENVKLATMGMPRVGDYDFALWHTDTFTDSIHVVHANDFAPRVITIDPVYKIPLYHPKSEVWYNNDMKFGDTYKICVHADRPFCSPGAGSQLSLLDHRNYFNVDLITWTEFGCPKNREAFLQNYTMVH